MIIKVPTKIEIKTSPGKGRGVFAIDFIKRNEIIEICHLVILEGVNPQSKFSLDYSFGWKVDNKYYFSLPLGYGGIYNHSDKPNATYEMDQNTKTFIFYALKDINPGEEICTFFGGKEYWDQRPWTKKV